MDAETLLKSDHSEPSARADAPVRGVWSFDRFELDIDRGEFRADGTTIPLRPKTFALLCYLVAHPARLISKDELLDAVWPQVVVTEDSVIQCVGELRSAMGDQAQALIKTVPRRGYMLDARVKQLALRVQPESLSMPPQAGKTAVAPGRRRSVAWVGACVLVAVVLAGALSAWWLASRPVHIDSGIFERRTIAILPFTDRSDPPSPDLAEAVGEDLTVAVSKLSNTLVLAYGSTSRLSASKKDDVRRAGEALGASHVLTGSVQRSGDTVLIRAQLQRTDNGAVLWSDRFEYSGPAQWNWQQDITQRIANALNDRLYSYAPLLSNYAGVRPGAIDATLQAIHLQRNTHTREEVMKARALFEQALAIDPNSAVALLGLGVSHLKELNMRWSTQREQQTELASQAIERAIALRPDFAVAYYARSQILYIRGRIDEAAQACEQALKLWPNQPMCLRRLGFLRLQQGRPGEVAPLVQLAMRLDPLDTNQASFGHFYLGMAQFHLQDDDKAYEEMKSAVAVLPQNGFGWQWMAAIDALHGRDAQARANLASYEKIIPGHTIGSLRATETSTNPQFWRGQDRFYLGLRKAGLPQ